MPSTFALQTLLRQLDPVYYTVDRVKTLSNNDMLYAIKQKGAEDALALVGLNEDALVLLTQVRNEGSPRQVVTPKTGLGGLGNFDDDVRVVTHPDFGLVPDGVTDSLPGAQEALASLPASGGEIYFPASEGSYYRFSAPWVIDKPVKIRGAGKGGVQGTLSSTQLKWASGSSGILLGMTDVQANGSEISDLVIMSERAGPSTTGTTVLRDVVLNSTTTITSDTGFPVDIVGATVTGTGIPYGTTVIARVNANTATLSAAALYTSAGLQKGGAGTGVVQLVFCKNTDDGLSIGSAFCSVRRVNVVGFGRHGFVLDGSTVEGVHIRTANLSRLDDCSAELNHGHGLYMVSGLYGTNQCTVVNFNSTGNGGVGLWNNGAKNIFIGAHVDYNYARGFFEAGVSSFWLPYAESSNFPEGPKFELGNGAGGSCNIFAGGYGSPTIMGDIQALAVVSNQQHGRWNHVLVGAATGDLTFQAYEGDNETGGTITGPAGSMVRQHKHVALNIVSPSTTVHANSNGADVAVAGNIHVASTAGFPLAGQALITTSNGPQLVTYTNASGGILFGCTGGTGTLATGNAVQSVISAHSTSDMQIAVAGSTINDAITVSPYSFPTAGIMLSAYINQAGTVTVRLSNVTPGALALAATAVRLCLCRH